MRGTHQRAWLVGRPTRRVVGSFAITKGPRPKRAAMIGAARRPPVIAANAREHRGIEERRDQATLAERTGASGSGDSGDPISASRLLAERLIAGLADRPFRPTTDQLARAWGGDLARGETRASRVRIAAGRYAALLADHVIEDMSVEGAPAAYARIWLCARSAFITSGTAESSGAPDDPAVSAWEDEGGAVA